MNDWDIIQNEMNSIEYCEGVISLYEADNIVYQIESQEKYNFHTESVGAIFVAVVGFIKSAISFCLKLVLGFKGVVLLVLGFIIARLIKGAVKGKSISSYGGGGGGGGSSSAPLSTKPKEIGLPAEIGVKIKSKPVKVGDAPKNERHAEQKLTTISLKEVKDVIKNPNAASIVSNVETPSVIKDAVNSYKNKLASSEPKDVVEAVQDIMVEVVEDIRVDVDPNNKSAMVITKDISDSICAIINRALKDDKRPSNGASYNAILEKHPITKFGHRFLKLSEKIADLNGNVEMNHFIKDNILYSTDIIAAHIAIEEIVVNKYMTKVLGVSGGSTKDSRYKKEEDVMYRISHEYYHAKGDEYNGGANDMTKGVFRSDISPGGSTPISRFKNRLVTSVSKEGSMYLDGSKSESTEPNKFFRYAIKASGAEWKPKEGTGYMVCANILREVTKFDKTSESSGILGADITLKKINQGANFDVIGVEYGQDKVKRAEAGLLALIRDALEKSKTDIELISKEYGALVANAKHLKQYIESSKFGEMRVDAGGTDKGDNKHDIRFKSDIAKIIQYNIAMLSCVGMSSQIAVTVIKNNENPVYKAIHEDVLHLIKLKTADEIITEAARVNAQNKEDSAKSWKEFHELLDKLDKI